MLARPAFMPNLQEKGRGEPRRSRRDLHASTPIDLRRVRCYESRVVSGVVVEIRRGIEAAAL
jgi:hypothetical protein